MSRMAAYLGPRAPATQILEAGAYSLVTQAKEFPDGFGLGWYPEDHRTEPVRFTSPVPAWRSDPNLGIPRRYFTSCALASIRHISGDSSDAFGIQPFASDPFLFAHDGFLQACPSVFLRPLRERLSDEAYPKLRGTSDSELLFALWLDALGSAREPDAIAGALESMVSTIHELAHAAGVTATFAIVVSDGNNLITLRTATRGEPPSLYTIVAPEGAPVPATGRVVASEPLFAGEWTALDPHSLVIFSVETSEDNTL